MEIRPHSGPQEQFLSSPADIVIYGGAAGGGKSYGLLMEPLRHVSNPQFGAVILRKNCPEITNEGGLWDESSKLYSLLQSVPRRGDLSWQFPSGAMVSFSHLESDRELFKWQGSQICLLGFDELTHFSKHQFFYMLSRNRSTCGVRPYVRATCNPDADSWVAEFIAWWWDELTGYPIPERAGVVRWFVQGAGGIVWADTPAELLADYPDQTPKSVTFIPAKLEDNPTLEANDPGYRANLQAQSHVERERLLHGNWLIRGGIDEEFPGEWFDDCWADSWPDPSDVVCKVCAVDPSKGKTEKSDFSAIVSLALTFDGVVYCDASIARRNAVAIVRDGLRIGREHNADQFGVESNGFQELLADTFAKESQDQGFMLPLVEILNTLPKPVRIRLLTPYLERRQIKYLRTPGARLLVSQLREFPNGKYDDGPDALEMGMRMVRDIHAQINGYSDGGVGRAVPA